MTGLGVERMPRTACLPPSGSPVGVRSSLPPFIQGAERRTERRARLTAVRWSLRVLVVGGLAGAAWLLTGAAAQAADRADGPVGSLLGTVLDGDTTAPVTGLLEAAAQPLETARPAHHQHNVVRAVLDVPRRVLTRPVETIGEVTHGDTGTPVDAALGGVDRVLRDVAGPLRLTDGPAATRQQLTAVPAPAHRVPHLAGTRPQQPVETPAEAVVEAPAGTAAEPVAPRPQPDRVVSRSTSIPALPSPGSVARKAPQVKHGKAASAPAAHRPRTVPHAVTAGPATAAEETPSGDGPAAPLRLHLGDVSGTSTPGSGTPTEGGSAAFLPAAIANSTMASQRLLIASDVEVRRLDAEAPTVSPD